MEAYIAKRADFHIRSKVDALSWTLPIASISEETGTMTIRYDSNDYSGDWVYVLGHLFSIHTFAPDEAGGTATITTADPASVFDRPLVWPDFPASTYGEFIRQAILNDYVNCADEAYRIPYIDVDNSDSTPLVPPELSSPPLYSLSDVIWAARGKGVLVDFEIRNKRLRVSISTANQNGSKNVFFTDGHAKIESETYTREMVSKITVYKDSTDENNQTDETPPTYEITTFYLKTDNSVVDTQPNISERVTGEWEIITCNNDEDPLTIAKERFAENIDSHKVEFYSDKPYDIWDNVSLRIKDRVFTSKITMVSKTSQSERTLYKCGDLATTLTEKVKASSTPKTSSYNSSGNNYSSYEPTGEYLGEEVYGVGDVYITTCPGNPAFLLGYGQWRQIIGKMLYAADSEYTPNIQTGRTGGSNEHTLTIDEMPSHTHQIYSGVAGGSNYGIANNAGSGGYAATGSAGNGRKIDMRSAFEAVYMWVRIA